MHIYRVVSLLGTSYLYLILNFSSLCVLKRSPYSSDTGSNYMDYPCRYEPTSRAAELSLGRKVDFIQIINLSSLLAALLPCLLVHTDERSHYSLTRCQNYRGSSSKRRGKLNLSIKTGNLYLENPYDLKII